MSYPPARGVVEEQIQLSWQRIPATFRTCYEAPALKDTFTIDSLATYSRGDLDAYSPRSVSASVQVQVQHVSMERKKFMFVQNSHV